MLKVFSGSTSLGVLFSTRVANMSIFPAGTANPELAVSICQYLGVQLGRTSVSAFPDGETSVQIFDSVRGADVFVIQPTCPPVNDRMMELLLFLDALKRSSALRITAVIPYFGYARQDRKHGPREPITAKLMADLITEAGASRVLFVDLHATQIQGFFSIPADNLRPDLSFVNFLSDMHLNPENTTIIAPNAGGARRAQRVAAKMKCKIAILETRTVGTEKVVTVVGTLKENAVLFDDMIDTGERIRLAAPALKAHGAVKVFACATHAVLSGDVQRLQDSEVDLFICTDTIPVPKEKTFPKLKVLKISNLLAEAIRRLHNEESMSDMF